MKRIAFVVTGALAAIVAGALFVDRYGATRVPHGTYDAIIVAGCAVRPTGLPSDALARRTRLAVSLYERGLAPAIIFTGGVGPGRISEARAAARLAAELGVPHGAMLLEEQSRSTEENAAFSRRLTSARKVLLATDGFHVFRSELIFGRYFDEALGVGTTSTYARTRWLGALRELPLIPVALVWPISD